MMQTNVEPRKSNRKMKQKRIILVATLMLSVVTAMGQSLNSAYFTEEYKFRHDMNPAFGNEQNYVSIPALGNINVRTQGNFGYKAIFKDNPNPYGNKTLTTFLNPYIDVNTALDGFTNGNNRIVGNVGITILSAGFKSWGGYNTIEINSRTSFGVSLPYELFEFAKKFLYYHFLFVPFPFFIFLRINLIRFSSFHPCFIVTEINFSEFGINNLSNFLGP